MKNRFYLLSLILVLFLSACGGDGVSESDAENILKKTFTGEDVAADFEKHFCEEDVNEFKEQNTQEMRDAMKELNKDRTVNVDCKKDGDVMTCTIKVEPALDTDSGSEDIKFDIKDGKLCQQD